MTDREKLYEMIVDAENEFYKKHHYAEDSKRIECVVDFLLANGVTMQQWIPLTEEKPGRDERVLVFFEGMRGTQAETQVMLGWAIDGSATHWQPLPEPPKGVNRV